MAIGGHTSPGLEYNGLLDCNVPTGRDAALIKSVERLNKEWDGEFSTAYGPIQAYYFFWDRIGDIDYLNLEMVFSKNPKTCYKSLKRTIGRRDKNFRDNHLRTLALECVTDIFETVKKEGVIMRDNALNNEDPRNIGDHYNPATAQWEPKSKRTSPQSRSIEDTLKARGERYGEFREHAQLSQDLKDVMHCAPNWPELDHDMREALDMAQHKIARILNGGNPNYLDSWVDICGYIQLVINRLEEG